jgi:hypothetical protein
MKCIAFCLLFIILVSFSTKPWQAKPVENHGPDWGFYGHEKINYFAVFLLPPDLLKLYKKNITYIKEHSTDPDKRRYAIPEEGPRHYIDLDKYGKYPYDTLPRNWQDAVNSFTADTLQSHGIVPWWVQTMQARLTLAFKNKDLRNVLKLSAEIGHYIGDMHVPLHTSSNHNGQKTGQNGIHGFWESRVPELLAEKEWDFVWEKADYIKDIPAFTWSKVLESALAADSVLGFEKKLNASVKSDSKYAFEKRNNVTIRQYSSTYTKKYNAMLKGMVERRFRQSVYAVASFWYTAWVNAGQPDISSFKDAPMSDEEKKEMEALNASWNTGKAKGRICD